MIEGLVSASCVLGVPSLSDCAVCGDGVRPDIITIVGRQLAFDVRFLAASTFVVTALLTLAGMRVKAAAAVRECETVAAESEGLDPHRWDVDQ